MSDTKSQSTETKTRTASKESVLKMDLRHVRRDLAAANKRGTEFAAIKTEMAAHEGLVEKLTTRETALKASLIKELGLG